MQTNIKALLFLCTIIPMNMVMGMEEFTKKTCVITEAELLAQLPKPHRLHGTPYPIEPEEGESDEDFKNRKEEWSRGVSCRSHGRWIPNEGAFLKIVTPSCIPQLIELEIEPNIFNVSFTRSPKDHNKIEIKAAFRRDENTGEYPENKLLAELLVPSNEG